MQQQVIGERPVAQSGGCQDIEGAPTNWKTEPCELLSRWQPAPCDRCPGLPTEDRLPPAHTVQLWLQTALLHSGGSHQEEPQHRVRWRALSSDACEWVSEELMMTWIPCTPCGHMECRSCGHVATFFTSTGLSSGLQLLLGLPFFLFLCPPWPYRKHK